MEASISEPDNTVREVGLPIYQSKGWLKLLGILSIISGAMTALTLVGIVVAWLPIWMGVLLLQAASRVERSQMTGDKVMLYESLGKLKLYFTINGVMSLIGIITTVAVFVMVVFFGILAEWAEMFDMG